MRKKLLTTCFVLVSFFNMYAGGLLTNTSQNVSFLRNPARGASMEIDAAYTNPAGLAFLNKEGLSLSLNNVSSFQTRIITTDFAPFAGFGGNSVKKFEGKANSLVIPNLQAAYKTGNWAFSANIGVAGGGGSMDFSKGLSSFESVTAAGADFLKSIMPAYGFGEYSVESKLKGTSIIYGVQLGATYKIIENFSAYAGFRYNYVTNSYKGHLYNQLSMGGNLVPSSSIIDNPGFAQLKPLLTALIGDKELDCKQTGSGIAPVIGLDYNWNSLNIGVKYEFKTGLELKNKTKTNTTGVKDYDDKAVTPYDIPALFTVGAQYDFIPQLTVSAGYHHYFDSDAKMAKDRQKLINGGINEYMAGVEYRINNMFLVSCGTMFTRTGTTEAFQTDMNLSLNSYSVGLGGAINITDNIRINLAYTFANYSDRSKNSTDYGNLYGTINTATSGSLPAIPAKGGKDIFDRTNNTFGIGLDFSF